MRQFVDLVLAASERFHGDAQLHQHRVLEVGQRRVLREDHMLPSRDFPMLIDLYLQGRLYLQRFVSETVGIGDVEEAFHKMERGEVLRSVVVF